MDDVFRGERKENMIKKSLFSFVISCCIGLIIYVLLEWIGSVLLDMEGFSCMTPEYLAMFPSATLAFGTAVLLHGLIGAAFAGATFIYEKIEIGFILQNIVYFILTGMVWIPVICFVWQLYRYPESFFCTIGGFVITYMVMLVLGYKTTKKEVDEINSKLKENQ